MRLEIELWYPSGESLRFLKNVAVGDAVSLYDGDVRWARVTLHSSEVEGVALEVDEWLQSRADYRIGGCEHDPSP